jgi:hypothetical protein
MEDVLDLYEEPYDPQYPTVCLDEKPVVLLPMSTHPFPLSQASLSGSITRTNAKGLAICL